MARKAIVDKDIILNMLREGQTTQRIAEKFNVSRQAIDLYRRDFIKKGFLPDQRAVRNVRAPGEVIRQTKKRSAPKQAPPPGEIVSLDDHIDLIIDAFNALKRLPKLQEDIEKYKQEYENALRQIERLKENEKKRLEQENRWLLTQRRDDTSPT